MKRVTIGIGHITNSSSVVHYFDKRLLGDPDVKAFVEAYGLGEGRVGADLWHRGHCSSYLPTKEAKHEASRRLSGDLYPFGPGAESGTSIREDDDEIIVIYGDEYESFARDLCELLAAAAKKLKFGDLGGHDYN